MVIDTKDKGITKKIEDLNMHVYDAKIKYIEDSKIFQAEQGIAKAKKTESGLHILTLKKGTGKKFSENKETTIHYTI